MVRLLDASIELNTWAVAFNVFALWVVSASIAGLVFALSDRQPRQRSVAATQLAAVLVPSGSATVKVASGSMLANCAALQDQTVLSHSE